jgi:N4-gp56 family major capsid protein
MATGTTTYGDITPRTAVTAAKRLQERGQHNMVTELFGQFDPQPRKGSLTRKWRRYNSLAIPAAPLSEGVTPTAQKLTHTDITAILQQEGDLVVISDVIEDTHEDPVLMEAVDMCGEQAAELIESRRIATLKGGTSVFYANGVASRTLVNAPPARGDFRRIFRSLKNAKAREISRVIKAGPNIATEPVAPAYFVFGHTDLLSDLKDMVGWLDVENYSDSTQAVRSEYGKCEGFRFVLTPMFTPWSAAGASGTTYLSNGAQVTNAAACDVYPMIIVARDSYAIVPLAGSGAVKPMVLNPGKPSKSDPLGQRGYVSWKTWQACARLNETWMYRYEVACTAAPSNSNT